MITKTLPQYRKITSCILNAIKNAKTDQRNHTCGWQRSNIDVEFN